MTAVLTLLLVIAVLGAWDTLWFHEYRDRLPHRLGTTRAELRLHVVREFVYVVIFGVLAWWAPSGLWVVVAAAAFAIEIAATLADSVVEDRHRPAIGGIAPGERVLHTLIAIVYGAMMSRLVPVLVEQLDGPSQWVRHGAPAPISIAATATAVGLAAAGTRNALALRGFGVSPDDGATLLPGCSGQVLPSSVGQQRNAGPAVVFELGDSGMEHSTR